MFRRTTSRIKVFANWLQQNGYQSQAFSSTATRWQNDASVVSTADATVFSGIQPTGTLHLGNYFGAVKLWKELQDDARKSVILSVVDLHAMTLPWNPEMLRSNVRQLFIELLACEIDPEKTILFQQSHICEHTQLQWIFSCLTTMARLDNLPQYKEKSAERKEVPCGLLMYPVLQAADILMYKAQLVPVGEDQVRHLQLAQHISRVFNHKYGKCFPHPQRLHSDLPRVKSLRDPEKKMSKSDTDPKSRIELTDSPDQIRSKLRKSVTDNISAILHEPDTRPGISSLLQLYKTVTQKTMEEVLDEVKSIDKVEFKSRLAESVIETLKPIQVRMEYLGRNVDYIESVAATGAAKARAIAIRTMAEVNQRVGLDAFHVTNR